VNNKNPTTLAVMQMSSFLTRFLLLPAVLAGASRQEHLGLTQIHAEASEGTQFLSFKSNASKSNASAADPVHLKSKSEGQAKNPVYKEPNGPVEGDGNDANHPPQGSRDWDYYRGPADMTDEKKQKMAERKVKMMKEKLAKKNEKLAKAKAKEKKEHGELKEQEDKVATEKVEHKESEEEHAEANADLSEAKEKQAAAEKECDKAEKDLEAAKEKVIKEKLEEKEEESHHVEEKAELPEEKEEHAAAKEHRKDVEVEEAQAKKDLEKAEKEEAALNKKGSSCMVSIVYPLLLTLVVYSQS